MLEEARKGVEAAGVSNVTADITESDDAVRAIAHAVEKYDADYEERMPGQLY